MARVLLFRSKSSSIYRLTQHNQVVYIRPTSRPNPGTLISCFYRDLWLIAYFYPIGSHSIRLVDENGRARHFARHSLEIEGEVMPHISARTAS